MVRAPQAMQNCAEVNVYNVRIGVILDVTYGYTNDPSACIGSRGGASESQPLRPMVTRVETVSTLGSVPVAMYYVPSSGVGRILDGNGSYVSIPKLLLHIKLASR